MCHGLLSNKESKIYLILENLLNEKGISIFRFDFSGHGESEGKFEDTTISGMADDILSSIDFLKKEGYKKIGVLGSSFNGSSIILAATKTKNIDTLILKSPVIDCGRSARLIAKRNGLTAEDWKKKGFVNHIGSAGTKPLNYTFLKDAENINIFKLIKKVKSPIFIVYGNADEVVSMDEMKRATNLIKESQMKIVRGANHLYTNPDHFKEAVTLIYEYITKNF